MKSIFLVTPDEKLRSSLSEHLRGQGFDVFSFRSLEAAFLKPYMERPVVTVLDEKALVEPASDNDTFLNWFRRISPILFVTANGTGTRQCKISIAGHKTKPALLSALRSVKSFMGLR